MGKRYRLFSTLLLIFLTITLIAMTGLVPQVIGTYNMTDSVLP